MFTVCHVNRIFQTITERRFCRESTEIHVDDLISGGDRDRDFAVLQRYQGIFFNRKLQPTKFESNSDNLNLIVHGTERSCAPKLNVLVLFWDRCGDEVLFCFGRLYHLAVEVQRHI